MISILSFLNYLLIQSIGYYLLYKVEFRFIIYFILAMFSLFKLKSIFVLFCTVRAFNKLSRLYFPILKSILIIGCLKLFTAFVQSSIESNLKLAKFLLVSIFISFILPYFEKANLSIFSVNENPSYHLIVHEHTI